jgi:hypothetical protein
MLTPLETKSGEAVGGLVGRLVSKSGCACVALWSYIDGRTLAGIDETTCRQDGTHNLSNPLMIGHCKANNAVRVTDPKHEASADDVLLPIANSQYCCTEVVHRCRVLCIRWEMKMEILPRPIVSEIDLGIGWTWPGYTGDRYAFLHLSCRELI